MKRLLLAATLAVACIAVPGAANAGCTSENRGGSAGEYDRGYVAFGDVTIVADQYGNFASGPAFLCSDGAAGAEPAPRGRLEISVAGAVVCSSGQRLSQDPFGFGAGVHSPGTDPCGAEISFDGIAAVFYPSPDDVRAEASGVDAGLRKDAPVTGTFWYGGQMYTVPDGTTGWYTRGVRAASEGGA